MAQKCALIVDDSATARRVLGRVLETYQLQVETAESAEDALEYLTARRPDVIFMDHLMPGMDGFEAVRAIKANPATATIPIMMYTSQAGELYVGQARALGAVGVLPKQIKPVDVSSVLQSLHLMAPDTETVATATPVVETDLASLPTNGDVRAVLDPADWSELHGWLEEMLSHHALSLRTDIERTVSRLLRDRDEISDEPPTYEIPPPVTNREPPRRHLGGLMSAGFAVLAALFFWLYLDTQKTWEDVSQQNAALMAALESSRAFSEEQRTSNAAILDALGGTVGDRYDRLLAAVEWGVNQSAAYPPTEIPFNDERLETMEELIARLQEIGFRGTVFLESHVADFCYIATPQDELELAPAELPAEGCDRIGLGALEARDLSAQQSVGFANFVAAINGGTSGQIRVRVESYGSDSPRYPYPPTLQGITAAEWNRIASNNQRVDVRLMPDNPSS